jgi:hypothetical protein
MGVGMQMLSQVSQNDPSAALDNLGATMALGLGVYVLLAIGGVIGLSIMTAAYRQIFGKPSA